jgi:flagellar protein FlaG
VVDDKTNEIIKEIPSSKLLDAYADMMEFVGLLVDRKI